MPRYHVEIQEIHTQVITVTAADEDEARLAAAFVLETGTNQDGTDLPEATEYKSTVDSDEWRVWE